MEIRARYILIGIFTTLVIVAAFGFVYWLNNAGGLGERSTYRVRFGDPVSGLLVGAGVYFNGIKVGEVTELRLDPETPGELAAFISVDRTTPVRADTRVGIEYQGLTGAAAVVLAGGSADSPGLAPSEGVPPTLTADAKSSRNWTDAARDVFGRMEDVLAENAEPVNDSIKNIRSFTDVLARNSERIDGILAGLERMTGGGAAAKLTTFELTAPQDFAPPDGEPDWQMVIPEPTVALAYNTDRLLLRAKPGQSETFTDARWTDNLPNLLQGKIQQTFENAGYLRAILRPVDALGADYQLFVDIRLFHLSLIDAPSAEAEFVARIVDRDGKTVAARKFDASVPTQSGEAPAAAAALNAAFRKIATELVTWATGAI